MRFTLLSVVALILLVCCCQTANCRRHSSSKNTPIDETIAIPDDTLPYYIKPNEYPSGLSLSYGPETTSTSDQNSSPSNNPSSNKVSSPDAPASSRALTPSSVTDDELYQISESLYNKENSYLGEITLNLQGKTRSIDTNDQAPEPLLKVSDKALKSPTIAKLRALFDNYEMDSSVVEVVTSGELKEEDEFLNAVLATNVMREAMSFLQSKGIVSSKLKDQLELLKTIWFTIYSRGKGKLGSSGFEHVFVNEINKGVLGGLHNWVYFNEKEKSGSLDYKGYLSKLDMGNKAKIIGARFALNGLVKPVNTMFIGTSPELEMALYTICFELRADEKCPVSLAGKTFNIQTNVWRYNGKRLIASAFPKI